MVLIAVGRKPSLAPKGSLSVLCPLLVCLPSCSFPLSLISAGLCTCSSPALVFTWLPSHLFLSALVFTWLPVHLFLCLPWSSPGCACTCSLCLPWSSPGCPSAAQSQPRVPICREHFPDLPDKGQLCISVMGSASSGGFLPVPWYCLQLHIHLHGYEKAPCVQGRCPQHTAPGHCH